MVGCTSDCYADDDAPADCPCGGAGRGQGVGSPPAAGREGIIAGVPPTARRRAVCDRPPPERLSDVLETRPCRHCAAAPHPMFGTTCSRCQGRRREYSPRAVAALAYYRVLTTVPARLVREGDFIWDGAHGWLRVVDVSDTRQTRSVGQICRPDRERERETILEARERGAVLQEQPGGEITVYEGVDLTCVAGEEPMSLCGMTGRVRIDPRDRDVRRAILVATAAYQSQLTDDGEIARHPRPFAAAGHPSR